MDNSIINNNTDLRLDAHSDMHYPIFEVNSEVLTSQPVNAESTLDGFRVPSTDGHWSLCSFTSRLVEPSIDHAYVRRMVVEALQAENAML